MIHGVCVAARVGGGVCAGAELHALARTGSAPSTSRIVNLLILTTSPTAILVRARDLEFLNRLLERGFRLRVNGARGHDLGADLGVSGIHEF